MRTARGHERARAEPAPATAERSRWLACRRSLPAWLRGGPSVAAPAPCWTSGSSTIYAPWSEDHGLKTNQGTPCMHSGEPSTGVQVEGRCNGDTTRWYARGRHPMNALSLFTNRHSPHHGGSGRRSSCGLQQGNLAESALQVHRYAQRHFRATPALLTRHTGATDEASSGHKQGRTGSHRASPAPGIPTQAPGILVASHAGPSHAR